MKIVLIEDDAEKEQALSAFLVESVPAAEVSVARSLTSGLRLLANPANRWELLVLDMSMPSFDGSGVDASGGPEGFENLAGEDLLAQMRLRKIEVPTIVVTMFETFGKGANKVTLVELSKRLERFRPSYRGLVYYSRAQEGWRADLLRLIRTISSP